MEFVYYDKTSLRVKQVRKVASEEMALAFKPDTCEMVQGTARLGQIYNPTTESFEDIDPLGEIAEWHFIKQKRNELEQAPILTAFGLFDADELSIKRMEMAIANFDNLPTLNAGKLTWKLADNTFVEVTKAELTGIYTGLIAELAVRAARLHAKAAELLNSSKTLREILQDTTWEV